MDSSATEQEGKVEAQMHALYLRLVQNGLAFLQQQNEFKIDPMAYAKVAAVAILHVAAIYSVDVGGTEEGFTSQAQTLYREAYANAPKFG